MKTKTDKCLAPPYVLLLATMFASSIGLTSAIAQPGQGGAEPFVETPRVQEFSGRIIVRPIQPEAWKAKGLSNVQALNQVAAARALLERHSVREYIPETDEYIIEVPAGDNENALIGLLNASGRMQYAEPDWIVYPLESPNDPSFGTQWHHGAFKMDSAAGWDLHTGGPSVSVGICDTGIRTSHQDLYYNRLEGYNAVDKLWEKKGGAIGPVHSHGTRVTGAAAANGNNGVGVTGVGWNLSHRMLRVSNSSDGSASLSVLQHAARTAVENGDRVANVSYSGVDTSSNLTTATYIKSKGGLLIWAAGNDGRNLTYGDRDDDDIIVVGATTSSDVKASFSAYGKFVDLTAPGQSIYTTDSDSDNDYASVSGTSFSAPLTAGLAALIWSYDPTLTPDEVETILKQGGDDLGTAGVDDTFGYGRINVFRSVSLVSPPSGNNPPVANDDSATTNEDTAVTILVLANDTDADGDLLTVASVNQGMHGGVASNTAHVTYTPKPDFNGTDSFTYTISDGRGGSDTATVTVTVNAVNDAPVANDDSATTREGTAVTIDVLANDRDVDGDSLSVASVTPGTSGSATINGTSVIYTPNSGFTGTDSFTYTISDGQGGSATARVTVNVEPSGAVGISLSANGYKLKGQQYVDLKWSGGSTDNVDIYRTDRDNQGTVLVPERVITTTANDGAYTDAIGRSGWGSYIYKVCEAGSSSVCSNTVQVNF
jgi:thermitase